MLKSATRTAIVVFTSSAAAWAQAPAGGEFQANTFTPSRQSAPRAAMAANGDFIVAWASRNQDGSLDGAFGQRFAASGAPRGSEFRINTYTTGYQTALAMAAGPRGDF